MKKSDEIIDEIKSTRKFLMSLWLIAMAIISNYFYEVTQDIGIAYMSIGFSVALVIFVVLFVVKKKEDSKTNFCPNCAKDLRGLK